MGKIFYKVMSALWQLRKAQPLSIAVMAGLALLTLATPALAIPQEYSITAIGVDNNRAQAEAFAMNYAKTRALYLAAVKMGVVNAEEKIMHLTPEQLAQCLRGATVDKTRREENKTYQLIRVTVAEDQLRAALGQKAAIVASSEPARARSVLLIPALVGNERMWVWEKENTLRAPLSDEILRQSRGIIMLPSGDLQDLRLIDQFNATKVAAEELQPMFERYGAQEIIIASVSPGAEETTNPTKILLHRVTPTEIRNEVIELPPVTAADTPVMRIQAAAKTIASAAVQIASSTADTDREKLAKATKIPVYFVYNTPRELGRMSDAIRKAPSVLQLELPSIALGRVNGIIYLEGDDKTALHASLASKGLIVREQGSDWSIATR